jgi:flagellin
MQIERAQALGLISSANRSKNALGKIFEKLATGQKINRASDDAAGLSVSEQMRTQIRGFQAANINVEYAQSAQNIAEGTGNEVTSILQRQRELAVQADNGTLTAENRSALDQEYQQLNQELTRISNASQFNTQNVANGTGLGAGGGEVLAAPNPGGELPIKGANFTAENLGTTATNLTTPQNAQQAISALDTALQNVSGTRTDIGANLNRMQHAYENNLNAAANTQEAESRIRDQDYAEGVMEQTRQALLNQTGMAALQNFNEVSRNNLMFLLR